MRLRVGTSGYAYKEWKGIFYPEKISPRSMLRFYAERLDAVEINYTFHHMPTQRSSHPGRSTSQTTSSSLSRRPRS